MPTLHFSYGTQWNWQPYDPDTNLGGEGGIQQYAMGEQKVHFDGPNKYIVINEGFTALDVQTDIYSAWKEWVQNLDNSKYQQALTAIGGDPITDSTSVGITYFLENGWRLKLPETDGTYNIAGNIYTREPGQSPYLPPDGDFDTSVEFIRSNIVDLITISGNTSLSNSDLVAIGIAVWDTLLVDATVSQSFGEHVRDKILTRNKFIALND
jgi:hypothetical protein